MSQFPLRKQTQRRTILNRSLCDSGVKMADPEAGSRSWSLKYAGLTDEEIGQLQDLFNACEGKLRDFVWLDPSSNLLRWTEDLSKAVWQTSLLISNAIEDPNGGIGGWRLTNAAQASQGLTQSVEAPGWYHYSFSVAIRSSSTDKVELRLSSSDGSISIIQPVASTWQQVSISGQIPGTAEEIRCSIETPGGTAVDIYGPQLEAQRDASAYRKNTNNSGVLLARFDQDEFECISNGPNNHSAQVTVVSMQKVTT